MYKYKPDLSIEEVKRLVTEVAGNVGTCYSTTLQEVLCYLSKQGL